MIILDSCVIRGLNLEDSSADLLRAFRAVGVRVGIPWMVAEELVAQHVIRHQEAYATAATAFKNVERVTPWEMDGFLGDSDPERLRKHWHAAYGQLAEVLPTSEAAMRGGLYREANALPPCKANGRGKTGARDATIWLSAVEYAREHPNETVHFVSGNTKDFTDGSAYPAPMDEDVTGLGDRFVHLTALDEVAKRLAEEVETDQDAVRAALEQMAAGPMHVEANATAGKYGVEASSALGAMYEGIDARTFIFATSKMECRSVSNTSTYRIGNREWCTATIDWLVRGIALIEKPSVAYTTGFSWKTVVLFTPDENDPRLTVLRESEPRPLTVEQVDSFLDGRRFQILEDGARSLWSVLLNESFSVGVDREPFSHGLPRSYEGALLRRARAEARQSAIEHRLQKLIDDGDSAPE